MPHCILTQRVCARVGEWQNDVYHGQGSLTYANGDTYTGTFRNGVRHGHGIYTCAATGEMVRCLFVVFVGVVS